MIAWLSRKLADALILNGGANPEDRDIYEYGLNVLLSTAANALCVLALGLAAGRMPETLIFLACFIALRSVAGGYHASTHFRCFLVMLAAYAAALAPTFLATWAALRLAALPAAAAAFAAVAALAPVPHENRPVSPAERARFRALSLLLAGLEAAACLVCFLAGLSMPAYAVSAGMLTAAVSLFAARAAAFRRTGKQNITRTP